MNSPVSINEIHFVVKKNNEPTSPKGFHRWILSSKKEKKPVLWNLFQNMKEGRLPN